MVNGDSFYLWKKGLSGVAQFGISNAHAETVFRNAIQTHYAVGHWDSFQRTKKTFPYLRYSAINDSRTSECCKALSGIIRRVDDPFWATHTPPNHHRCCSTLQAVTESQAKARSPDGKGLNQAETDLMKPQKGWDYNPALSHDTMLKDLAEAKIANIPTPSNWFKNTLREQMAKKLADLSPVVQSSVIETTVPKSMEHKTAQDLLDKLISNAEKATPENKLLELWSNPEKYHDHVRRRLKAGHITSESDYKEKTFSTLANAQKLIIAIPNQGDKISGKMELHTKDWIVLLGTNGEIVTSYPLNPLKPSFEDNETSIGNKIYEHAIDKRTREILKRVFDLSQ